MQIVAGGLEHLNEDGRHGTRRAIALIPVSMDDSPEGCGTPLASRPPQTTGQAPPSRLIAVPVT